MKNFKWIIIALMLVGIIAGASVIYSRLTDNIGNDNLVETDIPESKDESDYPSPDFTVTDRDGNEVRLSDFKGTPVVLNFWATWCYYCVEEMPDFDKASALYPDVQFLMVNATDGVNETVEKATEFVDEMGFGFDIYFDTKKEAVYSYAVSSFPQTYFINAEGEIVAKGSGMLDYDKLVRGIEMIYDKITVSPLAEENFLNPLEDYSWEREYAPEYVMLHFTSNVVANRENPYNIGEVRKIFEDNGLSINYIIDRDGKIFCYMPEDRVAWHAGRGEWKNDEKYTNAMNKYSIGIELLAVGSKSDMSQYLSSSEYDALDSSLIGFTDAQYESLKTLLSDVCQRNHIPLDREHIIGHDEYNPTKNDPGEKFYWDKIFQ